MSLSSCHSGNTPIYEAAALGQKKIVELLVAKGADVNASNKWGWTPLLAAACTGYRDVVEIWLMFTQRIGGDTSPYTMQLITIRPMWLNC